MTTQNKAVTCYLPKDIEDFITGYCTEYSITRKDKEGNVYPSLGTGIIELLKLLAYNPELVGSPLPDTVPSTISEAAIEKKIEDILEKKLSNLPDNVPSIEVLKDRLDNWVLAVDGDIKDVNQKIRDRSLQVDHQIASIKSRLDILEPLLKLQREALIANHHPSPPDEPGDGDRPDRPATAIEPSTPEVSPSPPDRPAIKDSEKKIIPLPDTLIVSPITDKTIDQNAIEDLTEREALATRDQSSSPAKKKGLTDSELARHLYFRRS